MSHLIDSENCEEYVTKRHKYGALLQFRVPTWATSLVGNMRTAASIPDDISDLLIFVAIESQDILTYDSPGDQQIALRAAFGLPV